MMSYSFKDEVISRIPDTHKFIRMFSVNDTETSIETLSNGAKFTSLMRKVDITTLFSKLPTIHVGTDMTYNDLYEEISTLYGLGLVKNIDYYNSDAVKPSSAPRYVELPISSDSYGYYGVIRCYVVLGALTGIKRNVIRDLRGKDISKYLLRVKVKAVLMSKCFVGSRNNFIENRFTISFINEFLPEIETLLGKDVSLYFANILPRSTITDFFSDGISDIVVVRCPDGEVFLVRIKTLVDDIPVISNETIDVKTDDSKELLVGNEIEVSEQPEEGKGDLNIQQSDSDISLLSVSPQESIMEDTQEVVDQPVTKKRTRKKR